MFFVAVSDLFHEVNYVLNVMQSSQYLGGRGDFQCDKDFSMIARVYLFNSYYVEN